MSNHELIIKIFACHLSEHLVVLVCNAHQLLNEAIWKVPTQHIRYQKRLVERAPAGGKQCGVGIEEIRDVSG